MIFFHTFFFSIPFLLEKMLFSKKKKKKRKKKSKGAMIENTANSRSSSIQQTSRADKQHVLFSSAIKARLIQTISTKRRGKAERVAPITGDVFKQ